MEEAICEWAKTHRMWNNGSGWFGETIPGNWNRENGWGKSTHVFGLGKYKIKTFIFYHIVEDVPPKCTIRRIIRWGKVIDIDIDYQMNRFQPVNDTAEFMKSIWSKVYTLQLLCKVMPLDWVRLLKEYL